MQENRKVSFIKQRDFYVSIVILVIAFIVRIKVGRVRVREGWFLPDVLL